MLKKLSNFSKILVLCFLFNLIMVPGVLAAEDKETDEKAHFEKIQEECLNCHKSQTKQEPTIDNDSLTNLQNNLIEKLTKPKDAKNLMKQDIIYESEPNYSESNADRIYLGYSVIGSFSSEYDRDCYKLSINQSGKLLIVGIAGHEPYWFYGKYYTIGLYDSNDKCLGWSHTEYSSSSIPGQVLDKYVTPGTYYIHLITWDDSIDGRSSMCVGESYLFRASMADVGTPVSSVSLNKSNIEMNVGDSENLTATIYPSDATNQSVSWSSSNSLVATVNCSGLVTTVGEGNARITVTTEDGNKTANCYVTVSERNIAVDNISLSKNSIIMKKGDTETLTAIICPSNASNQTVSWYSTNTAVATIDNGLVTAVGEGNATIMVISADGGKSASCEITVCEGNIAVDNISLSKNSIIMKKGDTETLTAIICPSNASNQTVSWYSTNTAVATIDNGLVTAVGEGNATIMAISADGGKSASCEITVSEGTSTFAGIEWDEKSDVPADKIWTVKFNEQVKPSTINSSNIYVATDDLGNNKVEGITVDSGDDSSVLLIPPAGGWEAGDSYYLFVTTGTQSAEGTSLNKAVRMKFTIELGPIIG